MSRALGRAIGGFRVRIRNGPNRGMWWSAASGGHGYRLGRFETRRMDALLALLRPGARFWDVGAHKGYVTLAAARAVGAEGRVVAVEPADVNREFLQRHVRWNRLGNVHILPVAISDRDGEAPFGGLGSSLALRLGGGDALVPTRTIDSLIARDGLPAPDVLKIDVEHSEVAVLRGAAESLPRIGLVWVSLHSRALYTECRDLLRTHGFRTYESVPLRRLSADETLRWSGDPEMLALGPDCELSEQRLHRLELFEA